MDYQNKRNPNSSKTGNQSSFGLMLSLLLLPLSLMAQFSVDSYGDQGVNENVAYTSPAASITGTPVGTVTYSLSGPDASLFTINSSNGVVSMVERDYESPLDTDGNNLYSVTVVGTDSDTNTSERELDVVVFNDCSASDTPQMFKLSAPDSLGDTMGDTATLRISLIGSGGVPQDGVAVMFVKTSGPASITSPSGTTNASGIYESTVTSASAGVSEFTAMYDTTGNGTPDTTVTLGSPTAIQFTTDVSSFNTGGHVGIGTETPDSSTVLEVAGTDKGVLIPRVALTGTADTATITNPAVSLLVYNTAAVGGLEVGFVFWDGSEWKSVCAR
ncbi:hypothetical protein BST97_14565 [Nonlabens spongiae]|uniref:Cadherin domain-containing protein n=1 Tax=Nonlabens spongiae TaxID=331648 RepID=A0A1W6MNR3_9FLAO|nr:hypothetical protein [Nonlabens spongiae]ARN79109.1 hypothetical protein BST97_14565 [Nonlabens spongiae]